MKEVTLGSLFDGLGGWLLSAKHNNIKPVWSSEIDGFAMAVSKHHFPDVEQLGDITKLDGTKVQPVDIICAGSPCFVAGTSIQTKDGIKPIEDIIVGDMVVADDCRWHKVAEVMKNQTESLYTIKAQGLLELKATGNHPFLVKHMKRHYPTKENGKRCNLRKFSKAEWIKVENLKKGDFVGYPILKSSENVMNITKEEAWLVGRYIADGYIINSQRKDRPLGQRYHKVIYCIGKRKLDNFKRKIKNYHVCYKENVTVIKGEIVNKRLMQLCMLCGKGAEHKEIPGVFLDLPKELLQELINGYMSGDGSKTGNSYSATTISKKLALSLQAAIHKVFERPVKVYYCKRSKKSIIQGRKVNQKDTYKVTWLDNMSKQSHAIVEDGYVWQPIKEIKRKEQKTIVYNFEVADDHSYTANGIMVHNCQSFSIAGTRAGFEGQSGLFSEAVRIIKEMRSATNNEYPKFFIFENVPGLFNSNSKKDFQRVLEEIGQANIPMPESGRWAKSGMVRTDTCDIAWRVLDAQYWGVPQRRKRIFLIADFREKQSRNTEVLFESESLPRNTAPSRNERQRNTAGVKSSIGATNIYAVSEGGDGDVYLREKAGVVTTGGGKPGQGYPCILQEVYTIAGNTIDRQIQNGGNSKGVLKDKSYTLNTIDRHAVTEPICIGNGQICQLYPQEKVGTLNCMHDQQLVIYPQTAYSTYKKSDTAGVLKASGGSCGGGSENLIIKKLGDNIE